jgi:ABC-type branched-subunit amino acid transport system substrate-binding protein
MYEGAKPTQDLLNQMGGITVNGQKYNIEYSVQDDKSSPPDGVAAANKLIQDGVKYIVAPIFPPVGLAMAPVCEQAKVLRVNPTQNEPKQFGKENPYYFDAWMTAYDIPPTYDYLQKHYPNAKRIALIAPDDPGINTCVDLVTQECAKRGLTVVDTERFPTDTADFYPIVTKLLAQKPDAIDGIGGLAIWATGIINQAREQGFTGPIYADLIIGDPNLLVSMVKPQYLNDIFEAGPDVLSDQMSPIVKQLRPMVEKTGAQYILDSVNVLSATTVMLAGIQAAQSFDTDKVKAALENMNNLEIPWGKGIWSGEDLGGLKHMLKLEKVPMSLIMNGKIQFEWVTRQ